MVPYFMRTIARGDRMKEAKHEAEQIVSAYRAEMEAKYQGKLAKTTGSQGTAGSELQTSTNDNIKQMNEEFQAKKPEVEKMLVDLVLKVNPKAPVRQSAFLQ